MRRQVLKKKKKSATADLSADRAARRARKEYEKVLSPREKVKWRIKRKKRRLIGGEGELGINLLIDPETRTYVERKSRVRICGEWEFIIFCVVAERGGGGFLQKLYPVRIARRHH